MSVARRERAALVESLRGVGPEAATLCEGWTARDLAAHLVIREYRLDAAPGILIPAFAGHTAKVQAEVARGDWNALLDKIAAGPPLYSPLKALDGVANVAEMFIHTEDVRRAQPDWTPRPTDPELAAKLRRTLRMTARMTLAKTPGRVELRTPDGEQILTAGSGSTVTVTGPVEELVLFASGRVARVDFTGDEAAIDAVRNAPKSL